MPDVKQIQKISLLVIIVGIPLNIQLINAAEACPSCGTTETLLPIAFFAVIFSVGFLINSYIKKQGYFEKGISNPVSTQPSQSLAKEQQKPAGMDIEQELQKAKDMLDKGLIDEEEFKMMKKKIIDGS